MKNKFEVVSRRKISKNQAIEQFERFKETKDASGIDVKENHAGYSSAYAEGWQRIFGKKDEQVTGEEDTETET